MEPYILPRPYRLDLFQSLNTENPDMSSSKSAEEIKNRIAGEVTASLGINLLYVGQKLGIFEAMSR